MNNVSLIGRLTRDPDIHQANDNKVARFTLAVDRKYKQENGQSADFPACVAFGKTAEFIEKYIKQGTKIAIVGRIQTGSYKNREGNTIYTTDVVAENVEFAESKRVETKEEPSESNTFMDVTDGDGLPF